MSPLTGGSTGTAVGLCHGQDHIFENRKSVSAVGFEVLAKCWARASGKTTGVVVNGRDILRAPPTVDDGGGGVVIRRPRPVADHAYLAARPSSVLHKRRFGGDGGVHGRGLSRPSGRV